MNTLLRLKCANTYPANQLSRDEKKETMYGADFLRALSMSKEVKCGELGTVG